MSTILAEVIAALDEAKLKITSILGGTGESTSPAYNDPREGWTLEEEREGVSYRWPKGLETYETFHIYRSSPELGGILMGIGAAPPEEFYGQMRSYWVVFLMGTGGGSKRPVVVFSACDDYETTGDSVAVIRGKGDTGKEMFGPDDTLPPGYERLRVELFKDRVSGGYNRAALVATTPEEMLAHGAIQVQVRSLKPAQA